MFLGKDYISLNMKGFLAARDSSTGTEGVCIPPHTHTHTRTQSPRIFIHKIKCPSRRLSANCWDIANSITSRLGIDKTRLFPVFITNYFLLPHQNPTIKFCNNRSPNCVLDFKDLCCLAGMDWTEISM